MDALIGAMDERIRVVIAEDHTLVREGTRQILERHQDIEVVGEAADGEQAVSLAERLRPDVAIMDIGMPLMNGIEATRRIKASCPEVGVLILTVHEDEQYLLALLEAGAAGYLLKDVRGSQLVEAVRGVRAGEPILHPALARKVLAHFFPGRDAKAAEALQEQLTAREREVLTLAAKGKGNKDIARELALSVRTVQVHLSHIFKKLGVASRTEAVISGLRRGLVQLDELK